MAERYDSAPPLNWLFSDGEHRKQAFQYWVRDTAQGILNTAVHHSLKAMSIDACSAFGGAIGATISPLRYAESDARARRNWCKLRPEQSDQALVDAAMKRLWRCVGRTMAEFSVLDRLWEEKRIAINGIEHMAAVRDAGKPILVATLHLGNWETVPLVGAALGFTGSGIYLPPENRFDYRIAARARRYGHVMLAATPAALRYALQALKANKGPFLIFIDELVGDHVFAPIFGRALPPEGNIAYAARLAWMTGAEIIPAFCVRLGDRAQFSITVLPPVDIVRGGDKQQSLLTNVARLNAVIEPVITAHLDQWYYLLDLDLA